jgi:oxalate decarboxylase/phosphoglucose isomerase-like protein (cupin superfamily)
VIKGGTARMTDEHGKSTVMALKSGEVMYREDQHHEVENIGKTTIHVLNVELD